MKTKISVIIPAYNAQDTLARALDSVLAQSLQNIEIIVIDDASSDNTPHVIRSYADRDPRIIVIPMTINEGPGIARNLAMEKASGEYLTFLDADDWIEPDMYEKLYNAANGADVAVTGFFHDTLSNDGNVQISVKNATGCNKYCADRATIIQWAAHLDAQRLFAFCWNKLYRTALVRDVGLTFQNQTLNEDFLFNCLLWNHLSSLALTDGCTYHYIKSAAATLTGKFRTDYFYIMDRRYTSMRDLLIQNDLFVGIEREIVCNMHIKHVIAGMVHNFSPEAGYSYCQRRAKIKEMLKHPNCLEAIRNAKGVRKQEKLCNWVMGTCNVTINYVFAWLLYKMQTSKGKVFDKLK